MKFSTVAIFAAGVYRVSATAGVGAPLCLAGCLPLMINPIAYAACAAGCTALNVGDDEGNRSPRFQPDGTIVFEKETPQCAEACKPLLSDLLTYSACLGGCAGGPDAKK